MVASLEPAARLSLPGRVHQTVVYPRSLMRLLHLPMSGDVCCSPDQTPFSRRLRVTHLLSPPRFFSLSRSLSFDSYLFLANTIDQTPLYHSPLERLNRHTALNCRPLFTCSKLRVPKLGTSLSAALFACHQQLNLGAELHSSSLPIRISPSISNHLIAWHTHTADRALHCSLQF